MRPNWYTVGACVLCFLAWWVITTTFVSCMAPYMGNYR